MEIRELQAEAHQNAIEHGFYDGAERNFGEAIALVHAELSEAIEDYRNGRQPNEIYYEGEKPCGIPVEIADAIIRLFDIGGGWKMDLVTAIMLKMAYNRTRPYKHGKVI
jgi:hypothetical protein